MRPRFLTVSLFALLGVLAGCQTGEISKVVPISGGGQINVPLTREGIKPGSGGGYQVIGAGLEPGKGEREAYYSFAIGAKVEPALKEIRIDDISDETAATLVDDTNPKWENHIWKASTDMISADDPRMKWVLQITLSMRVYHVTLTRTDGTKVEFNHVSTYPPMLKGIIRSKWGEKY